uniref:Uncharacterized protein n=1 Tax=Myotis myotis TaxID=51298 RepID=A0A7J7V3Z7_MYOMY|nr:hypothetical protein mMyoMyo1_008498 [Myotis myotis]
MHLGEVSNPDNEVDDVSKLFTSGNFAQYFDSLKILKVSFKLQTLKSNAQNQLRLHENLLSVWNGSELNLNLWQRERNAYESCRTVWGSKPGATSSELATWTMNTLATSFSGGQYTNQAAMLPYSSGAQ